MKLSSSEKKAIIFTVISVPTVLLSDNWAVMLLAGISISYLWGFVE